MTPKSKDSANPKVNLKTHTKKKHAGRALLELAAQFTKDIPQEELDKLPTDLAHNHDHYLYGTPKK
jgi:hypothetical protein